MAESERRMQDEMRDLSISSQNPSSNSPDIIQDSSPDADAESAEPTLPSRHEIPPDVVSGLTASGNAVQPPATAWEGKLVGEMDYVQIEELSGCLDPDSTVTKNWYHLALFLKFSEEEINAMRRDGVGGGHPAKDFLVRLQAANVDADLDDFIKKVSERMKRNDIKRFLEEEVISDGGPSRQTKICKLPEDVIENLAEKLSNKGGVVRDWRFLASLYRFDHDSIQEIGSRSKASALCSPTQALFSKLRTSNPTMTIGELIAILKDKMKRFDVARKIESFYS